MTLYDSTGDLTTSTGTGSLVGTNTAPGVRYAPPVTGNAGDVQDGVTTAIRIETIDGATWEVCETVPSLSGSIFTYTRGTLLKSSTGSRVNFLAGTKQIRFVAPKEAFAGATSWTNLTTSATLVTGNNYRANSASLLTLTLPTANFGDPPIFIQGWGTGLWKLLGSGAILGGDNTASFTTYVESNNQYDSVWLYPQGGTAYAVAPVGGSLLTSV